MLKIQDGDDAVLVPTEAFLLELWRVLPPHVQQQVIRRLLEQAASYPVATVNVVRITGPDGQPNLL